MAVTDEECASFRAEPRIAALSVSAGGQCGQLTEAIRFGDEPGGPPWIRRL